MLKIISLDKMPNLRYEKQANTFVCNTIAFYHGLNCGDVSTFSPEVLEMMEVEKDWLETNTRGMMLLLNEASEENDNERFLEDFTTLVSLYRIAKKREFNKPEADTWDWLIDKYTLLLLTSEGFIRFMEVVS